MRLKDVNKKSNEKSDIRIPLIGEARKIYFYLRCDLPASLHRHHDQGDEEVGQGKVNNKIVNICTRSEINHQLNPSL